MAAAAPKVVRHRKVGPYKILGPLGKGGMAQVHRGLHETLQREVAIKELLPEQASQENLSRFVREALALASFRHQNIVAVYDLVEKMGSQFLVMELVDGPTLHELVKGGPLPPMVAAVIGMQLAAALEHAHFHRIIHRDLKPANVMLAKSGEVKLMDFGIARDEDLGPLTRTGMAVGTPTYMSPEQVSGAPLDARTDLYSLGVLLYECLAGVRPFTGRSAGEVFARVRDGKCMPLPKAAPHAPNGLIRIVRKAMRIKPSDRHADATTLRRELEAFVARNCPVSPQAVLLAFLKQRSLLTETEVLAHLTARELSRASFDAPPPSLSVAVDVAVDAEVEAALEAPPPAPEPRRSGRWMLALLLTAGLAAAGWYHPLWWPQVLELLGPWMG